MAQYMCIYLAKWKNRQGSFYFDWIRPTYRCACFNVVAYVCIWTGWLIVTDAGPFLISKSHTVWICSTRISHSTKMCYVTFLADHRGGRTSLGFSVQTALLDWSHRLSCNARVQLFSSCSVEVGWKYFQIGVDTSDCCVWNKVYHFAISKIWRPVHS